MNTCPSRRVRLVKPIRTSPSTSPKSKPARIAPLAAAIATVCLPSVVHAATATWTDSGSATWDTTATNWSSNVSGTPWDSTNGLTDAAVFNTAGAALSVSGTVWANSLTFSLTGTISNGTINLAGVSPTITGTANATIASVLDGSAGLTKSGSSTLTLLGSNTYTGLTSVTSGTLQIGNGGTTGSIASSGSISISSGATLAFNRTDNYGGAFSQPVTGSGQFLISSGSLTISSTTFSAGIVTAGGALTLGGNLTPSSLTFNGPQLGSYTVDLNGSRLSTSGGGINVNANALIHDSTGTGALVLNSTGFTINGGSTLTIDARVTGTGQQVYAGNGGSLTLTNNNNDFTGILGKQNGGNLTVTSLKNTGVPSAAGAGNAVNIGYNAGFVYTGTGDSSNRTLGLFGNSGKTLLSSGAGALVLTGSVSNTSLQACTLYIGGTNTGNNEIQGILADSGTFALSVYKQDAGKWILSGSNTYTGVTTVASGTLQVGNGGTTGLLSSTSSISISSGATLAFSRTDNYGGSLATPISGAGALMLNSGTLTLTGSNSYSGGVTVTGGALQVNNANALGTGTLTINSGASGMYVNTSGTVANSMSVPSGFTINNSGSNNLTLTGNLVGGANLQNTTASGTITLTGSNLLTSQYYPNLGTYRIGSNYAAGGATWRLSAAGCNLILLPGVNFASGLAPNATNVSIGMDTSGSAQFTGGFWPVATYSVNTVAGSQLTFNCTLYQSGTMNKTGAGTTILNSNYSAVQAFVVSGGVLQVSNTTPIQTSASYGTTLDGGTLQYAAASGTTSRPLTITANGGALDASGSGLIAYSSTAAVLYTGSGNRTLTLTGTNTGANTLAAAIADSGTGTVALVKSGAGTWVLSGSNGYSGGTQLNGGVLNLGSANAVGATGTISFGGGTLQFSAANTTDYSSGFSTATGQAFNIDTNGQSVTLASALSSSGGTLTKLGAGTLTLTGSNSYTGATTVSTGTLALGPSAVLSATSASLTLGGGALDLGTTSQTVGAVSLTAAAASGAATLLNGTLSGTSFAVSNASGTAVLSANLAGSGALTMSGAGTLWLSGSSTFSGGVTVNAGALQVNNANALGTGTLTIAGGAGALHFNLPTSGTVANSIVANTATSLYLDASNNLTLAGNIVPNSNISFYPNTPATSGTITFTGSNSFAGNYFCSGTNLSLRFGSNNAGGSAAWWPDGSARMILLDGVNFIGTLVPQGHTGQTFTVGMDASGTATFSGRIYTAGNGVPTDIDDPAGAQLTLSGPFSGSWTYLKTGAGTAIVSNAANALEAFVVSGGVLQVPNTSAIGTGTYGTTLDGGTLQYTGGTGSTSRPLTITANGGAFDASGSGPITYSSTSAVLYTGTGNRTLTLTGNNTAQNTLAATIADSGTGIVSIAKSGAGTWVLSASNSYGGGTVVSNGVLIAGNANATGTNGSTVNGGVLEFASPWWTSMASVVVNSGGALGLAVGGTSGFTTANIDAVFSGSSGAVLNAGALVALDPTNNGGTFTYSSLISGSVGIQKIGSNNLVLSTSNTYTGPTRITSAALTSAVLANGGQPSSIGASTNAASNLIIENGAQLYASGTTDRLFTLGASGQAWISALGGPLAFTNTGGIAVSGSATHNLRLAGSYTDTFAPAVHDYNSSNKTQLTVQNTTWLVTGTASDYTGITNIEASGVLVAALLANGNVPSSIGASTNAASNLVFGNDVGSGNNTLRYAGSGPASTDRLFTLGSLLGGGAVSTIDNSGGGLLSFTNTGAIAVATTASTTLAFAGSNAINFAPVIANGSGTVGVTMSGSSILTLTGSNTYTGATSITGGTLQVGNGGSIASTSSVSISSGATLAFSRTDNYGGNLTKAISGAGALTLNSGSLTLTGSNTYTGATTVVAGAALQLGDGVTGALASTVTLNNGSTLGINLPNGGIFNAGINIGPGTVNLTSSGTNTVTGQINGYAYCALNQNGSGTTVLSYTTNPFFGIANVNAGALQLNGQNAAYNATVNVGSGGLLTFGASGLNANIGALTGSGGVVLQNGTNGVTLTVGGNNQNSVFSGNLSGTNGSLTMSGTCVLALTGTSTYTGLTSVNSGTLQIGNGGASGSIASSGTISIASGATLAFNRTDSYDGVAFSQPVTGSGRMLISSGSLTVSSTSSFSGDIAVASGGTLVPGVAAPLPSANLDGEGGTLSLGPLVSASFGGLKGAGNLNVVSTSGSATLNVGGNNQTTTFSGSLSGSNVSLTKVGTGTLTLSGSSSLTGGVNLANGAIIVANASALGNGGALTITEDADIALNFNLPTSGTVSNAITFTKPGGTHNDSIVQNANNNLTLAGNIVATGHNLSFNEPSGIASGTFTLTGSNSFGGLYTSGTATFRIGSSYAAGGAVWRPSVAANMILLDGVNFGSTIGNSIASYGMDASGTAAFTSDVDQGSSLSINTPAGAQLSFTGVYRGNGAITKNGSGTAIFTNLYNYGMPITLSGGVIQVSNMAIVTGEIGAGISGTTYATTLDGGTFRYVGGSGSTARPLTLTANGGALDASGGGALVFSTPAVAYTGSGNRTLTLTGTNTGANTLAAAISDNGSAQVSVYKTGAGTWVLSGSNSYSGRTQLNSGVLNLGNANAIGATGTISFGGGTLQFSAVNTTDYSSQFSNAASQAYNFDTNGQSVTLASALSSSGGTLSKLGAGTLTLTGSNSYTGATTVSSGTLALGSSAVLSASTASLTLGGGALDLGTTSQTVGAVSLTAAAATGTATLQNGTLSGTSFAVSNTSGTAVLSANLAGSGALTKSGAGTLWLSGSNTFNGGLTVNAGTLQVNNPNALGTGTLTISNGAPSMYFNTSGTVSNPMSINEGYTFFNSGSNNLVLAGNINGNGSGVNIQNASASGTITLTGSNNFSINGFNIVNGTLRLGSNYALGNSTVTRFTAGAKLVLLDGVTCPNVIAQTVTWLGMDTSGTAAFSSYVYPASSYTVSTVAGSQLSFNGMLYTSGTLNKIGAGTAILNVSNAAQTPVVSGGVLQYTTTAAIQSGSNGITLDGGTLKYTGGSGTMANPINLTANGGAFDASGSGPITYSSTSAVTDTGSGNRTLTLTGTNTGQNTLAASIGDNGTDQISLLKTGAGTWVLSGSNSYTGGTQINAGVLNLGNANAIGATGTISFGGGTLQFSAANTTDYSSCFSSATGQAYNIDTNGQSVTLASALSSSGGTLTKLGAGTLSLTGNNTYDGATTVNSGTLQVGHGGTSGSLGSGSVTNNGSLVFNRFDAVTVGNVISGTGSLRQVGANTLTLSGSNTYTGATTINGGTLQLGNGGTTGSIMPASAITDNGTLAFNRSDTLTQGTDFAATISGSGSVVQAGAGTTILTGSNSYSGGSTINQGTLQLGNGGTTGSLNPAGAIVDNGTLAFNRSNTLTQGTNFASTISGSGNVVQIGGGTTILSGSNSYSGGTTVSSGSLQIGNANALGTGGLTVNGGALDLAGNSVSVPAFSGAGGAVTDTVPGTNVLTTVVSGTSTYAGNVMDGAGSVILDKQDTGELILSGSIQMTGLTTEAGSVQLTQSGSIGTVTLYSGATLSMAAHSGSTYNVLSVSSLSMAGFTTSPSTVTKPGSLNADGLGSSGGNAMLTAAGQSQSSGGTAAEPASPEAVPEPATFGLIAAAAGFLLGGRRLRRRLN